jgi:hypothetical protein
MQAAQAQISLQLRVAGPRLTNTQLGISLAQRGGIGPLPVACRCRQ